MNRFSVVRLDVLDATSPVEHLREVAVPVIDGMPLFAYIGDGAMPGLVFSLVAPPSRLWLDQPDDDFDDGRTTVLDGSCGVAGCCGVRARISIGDDAVTWGDFVVGPCRDFDLGPFVFERAAYEAALAECTDLTPVAWRLNPGADSDQTDDDREREPLTGRLRDGVVSVVNWPTGLWRRRRIRRLYTDARFSRRFGQSEGWFVYARGSEDDPERGSAD